MYFDEDEVNCSDEIMKNKLCVRYYFGCDTFKMALERFRLIRCAAKECMLVCTWLHCYYHRLLCHSLLRSVLLLSNVEAALFLMYTSLER